MTSLQLTAPMQSHNNLHYSYTDLKMPNNEYKIQWISKQSNRRQEVERFIHDSYAKNFKADINTFFPLIIIVVRATDDVIISALGVRNADRHELFSECYLKNSIEAQIGLVENCRVNRDKIVELGNFVVRDKSDIKMVMPVIAEFLKSINVDWLVYTLTRPIKSYFAQFDLELCYLEDAQRQSVNSAANDWGNYYNFKPVVYYTSVVRNQSKV